MIENFMKQPFDSLTLHISKGNRKIGRTHNFSMAPGITCANCSGCIKFCYDIKACWQYLNVRIARAENTAMMFLNRAETFRQIDNYISNRRANKFFRWHVSGDILDADYFDRMVTIARNHPDWVFWTYTKNYLAVNTWIDKNGKENLPGNLSIMYSVWNGMECVNPYDMPTFTCIMPGMEPDKKAWKCPGNCDACLKSGRGCPYGESSEVDLH
jgi:hypothetical protein